MQPVIHQIVLRFTGLFPGIRGHQENYVLQLEKPFMMVILAKILHDSPGLQS